MVTDLTFKLLRLCEFARNFSTFEVSGGNDKTVKVELSNEEQISSSNCDSSELICETLEVSFWHCSGTEVVSTVIDGVEEVEETDIPESGEGSLEEDTLGGGGGGRLLYVP